METSIKVIAAVLLAATLHFARSILLPCSFAFFIFLIFSPVVETLFEHKIPRTLSSFGLIMSFILLISWSSSFVVKPAESWMDRSPQLIKTFKKKASVIRTPLRKIMRMKDQIEEMTEVDSSKVNVVQNQGSGMDLGKTLFSFTSDLAASVITVLLLVFFLLSFSHEVISNFEENSKTRNFSKVYRKVQLGISRYLRTFSLINVSLGVCIALSLWLIDFPNPILWGTMACFLNFIPYFGPIVGASVVFLVGLFTYESFAFAFVPSGIYLAINSIEGQLVTPILLGNTLQINPLAIFLTMICMGWLWGVGGALLSVPLLVATKIIVTHIDSDHPVLLALKD